MSSVLVVDDEAGIREILTGADREAGILAASDDDAARLVDAGAPSDRAYPSLQERVRPSASVKRESVSVRA